MTTDPNTSIREVVLDVLVEDRCEATEDVVLLTLRRPDNLPLPAWDPGAHIDLMLGNGLVRQYSLCGDPEDRSSWQIGVLRESPGRGGSAFIHASLAGGDTLQARGPRNHFQFVDAARYLFVAGGIGITPLLPMMALASANGREWKLAYGGRTRRSMAFTSKLRQYGAAVEIWPENERGLIDLELVLAEVADDTLVYCCGPEPLIVAVEQYAKSWAAGKLHVERFVARENNDVPVQFDVELRRSGLRFTVPPDRSILEMAESAGVYPLNSCREGICGSCETAVLAGVPDHRDSVLTDAERAENSYMMICCSRAHGSGLVLDL